MALPVVAMSAARKWLEIFVDILVYEINHTHDGELLSEGCDRLVERSPVLARGFILAAGGALTLHLANAIPPQYDPFSRRFWARFRKC
ncbi:hypothetical protein JRC04_05215 [Mycolicibacterium sp. S2-37]|uniref:DUF7427 family protein n=1 Tax=Mycolicibacterium sp. S2-37 TaxID=2810297 RepID=UPI001A94900D|nr:hypothetical protein [Mycolicibacterium sp. S2-37]MBO0676854.1 hypothetical protein [Mycolicibacterium sp. S2-37]